MSKSSVDTIRARFDADVDRFADADTGQTTTMDSAEVLEMLMAIAAADQPRAESLMDIGCGAGNFSVRCLRVLPGLRCSLADLSAPMLERAQARVLQAGGNVDRVWQEDIRRIALPQQAFDLVTAAAVLHHLRSRAEWRSVLAGIFRSLKPGGCFVFWDLVRHEAAAVEGQQAARWSAYLEGMGGPALRDKVFAYVEEEDSPESASFILLALAEAGFEGIDIVHKNGPFVAMTAHRPRAGEA